MDRHAKEYIKDLRDTWQKYKDLKARMTKRNLLAIKADRDFLSEENKDFIIDELFRILK